MTYPEYVKFFLWSTISDMALEPGKFAKNPESDFTRKRKLDFESLLRFLISMESGSTGHELLKYFGFDINVPSTSAFVQQRQKLLLSAFQYLLFHLNSHFQFELYKDKYQLVACDGSEFNIARNPDDPDTYYPSSGRSAKGFNMIHTISLFDVLSKRYLDCVIQPGRKQNEFQALCDLVDRYPYETLSIIIADRGFSSFNVYAHMFENGKLFMIRAKDTKVKHLLKLDTLSHSIDTSVDIIITRTHSKKEWSHPELGEQYRYIAKQVAFDYIEYGSADEYSMSLRIIRIEVAEGIYENLITNLPFDEFNLNDIKKLYHLRWNIETSFRDLKHTIGTTLFHSKKVELIEQEIWARLILFDFCAIITNHVVIDIQDTLHLYQVNFAMAMKICHHFIRLSMNDPPPDVECLIGSYYLPIRPDRTYERLHRSHLTASFCYRSN